MITHNKYVTQSSARINRYLRYYVFFGSNPIKDRRTLKRYVLLDGVKMTVFSLLRQSFPGSPLEIHPQIARTSGCHICIGSDAFSPCTYPLTIENLTRGA